MLVVVGFCGNVACSMRTPCAAFAKLCVPLQRSNVSCRRGIEVVEVNHSSFTFHLHRPYDDVQVAT